jgi:hypothetical protein
MPNTARPAPVIPVEKQQKPDAMSDQSPFPPGHELRPKTTSSFTIAIAHLLDFLTIFLPVGYLVAYISGNVTEKRIALFGVPMYITLAVVAVYFIGSSKVLGTTLWSWILRIRT